MSRFSDLGSRKQDRPFVKVMDSQTGQFANITNQADLAIEQERNSTSAHGVPMPKYGQIRIEARLFCAPSLRHLRFPLLNDSSAATKLVILPNPVWPDAVLISEERSRYNCRVADQFRLMITIEL